MRKISAVYKIVNTVTGDCYVGSSRDVRDRWHEHKCFYKQKRFPNNQMYKDMQELGVDKFRFQILCPVEPEHLKQVEQELIEMLRPTYNAMRAYGVDEERAKKLRAEYERSPKRMAYNKARRSTEDYKKHAREYSKTPEQKAKRLARSHLLCEYNGEILTLNALRWRFYKAEIEHPTVEAKKYLIK